MPRADDERPASVTALGSLSLLADIRTLDIISVAKLVAAGTVSASELVRDSLDRIGRLDRAGPTLGAVIAIHADALQRAERLDAELRTTGPRSPLHGIPIVIKDNIDLHGLPTTSGCKALSAAFPPDTAPVVDRLEHAGAIVVAKTNLSEFSFEIRSRSSIGGDVRNPYNPAVSAGGSSGGTAAAVAAGFAIAGVGTDTGGSIRIPASYTGLVGLRPTYGALTLQGVAPLAPATDTIGPIARTVADARLLFEIMGGQLSTTAAAPLRVGLLRQAFGARPDIAAAAENAGEALRRAGVELVDPVELPQAVLPIDRPHIVDAEFADAFDAYLTSRFAAGSLAEILASGRYLPEYRETLERRMAARGAGRDAILTEHGRLGDAMTLLMKRHRLDALLYPTSMVTPDSLDNPKGGWAPELAACSGWPALSVPAGMGRDDIPIGVELLGEPHREAMLLQLGARIEQALGPRPIPPLD